VEIRTEAPEFLFWDYINGTFVAVQQRLVKKACLLLAVLSDENKVKLFASGAQDAAAAAAGQRSADSTGLSQLAPAQ
jgi:hypothetical protein